MNFVIISSQRSGSRWLVELLDSHPEVSCCEELFIADAKGRLLTQCGSVPVQKFVAARREAKERGRPMPRVGLYLDTIRSANPDSHGFGFKVMYGQLIRHPSIMIHVFRRQYRVVHLVRRHVGESVVSARIKEARGCAHATRRPELTEVSLSPWLIGRKVLKKWLGIRLARFIIGVSPALSMEVSYEDLSTDTLGTLNSVQRFLGVATTDTFASRVVKGNPYPLEDVVTNYNAIRRWMRFRG